MTRSKTKVKVGILGCGAIGSRIARSIKTECEDVAVVSALFDINPSKSAHLAKYLPNKNIIQKSYAQMLKSCDLVVEAVNAPDTYQLIRQALVAKKDVLVMSVGKLLDGESILKLAQKQECRLLIPLSCRPGEYSVVCQKAANDDRQSSPAGRSLF